MEIEVGGERMKTLRMKLLVSEPVLWKEGDESIGKPRLGREGESERNAYDLQGRYVYHRIRGCSGRNSERSSKKWKT